MKDTSHKVCKNLLKEEGADVEMFENWVSRRWLTPSKKKTDWFLHHAVEYKADPHHHSVKFELEFRRDEKVMSS